MKVGKGDREGNLRVGAAAAERGFTGLARADWKQTWPMTPEALCLASFCPSPSWPSPAPTAPGVGVWGAGLHTLIPGSQRGLQALFKCHLLSEPSSDLKATSPLLHQLGKKIALIPKPMVWGLREQHGCLREGRRESVGAAENARVSVQHTCTRPHTNVHAHRNTIVHAMHTHKYIFRHEYTHTHTAQAQSGVKEVTFPALSGFFEQTLV